MKELVLVRIDDRLIHGQIATQWLKSTHANKVLIIDDALPGNALQVRILKAAAPAGIKVIIKNTEEGIAYCKKDPREGEKILVLVKVPEVIEAMIDGGIPLPTVILGGMGIREGRERLNKNISASDAEIECMRRIVSKGTEILYQLVPSDMPLNFKSVLSGKE